MSGGRRRYSKWDHKDSEDLSEIFHDRAPPRKARESFSPSRASRRHENRSKDSGMTWDREGNCSRMSPGIEEWRHPHPSRSPRNGWSRSYRSRSRSRSRSPAHFQREPDDKTRNRTGVSAQICKDFAAGKCRRGDHCQFIHQDAQLYDTGRHFRSSSPDDRESRHRRSGGSRYSPDDTKDVVRIERSMPLCTDFLKGNCRRGVSCRYAHHDTGTDAFDRGTSDGAYRDRSYDRRRDNYPDRNHDREQSKRGETPCKFFAAGNCRNGTQCRFSHQVSGAVSPERQPRADRQLQNDRRRPDQKFDSDQVWEGPRWSDEATEVSNAGGLRGRGDVKNESTDVAEGRSSPRRHRGDGRSHSDRRRPEGDQVWEGPRWSDVTTTPSNVARQGWGDGKNETAAGMTVTAERESRNVRQTQDGRREDLKFGGDKVGGGPTWTGETTTLSNVTAVQVWGDVKDETTEAARGAHSENQPRDRRQSENDTQRPFKLDNDRIWEGPRQSDATVINTASEQGWGNVNYDTMEVTKGVSVEKPRDDSLIHDPAIGQTWNDRSNTDEFLTRDGNPPLQWKTEDCIRGMVQCASGGLGKYSADMRISPKDIHNQYLLGSSDSQTTSNISVTPVQQRRGGEVPYDRYYSAGLQEQKVFNNSYSEQNPNFKEDLPPIYHNLGKNAAENVDNLHVTPNPAMNLPQVANIFSSDQRVIIQPSASMNPAANHPQLPSFLNSSGADVTQSSPLSSYVDRKVSSGLNAPNSNTYALAPGTATNNSLANSQQLAQLSNLSASLAQLLENRQQLPQLLSAVTPSGISNLSESVASVPSIISGAFQPNQAAEVVQHYDPLSVNIDVKRDDMTAHALPANVEPSDIELHHVNPQKPPVACKDDANGGEVASGRKAPENGQSEEMGGDVDGVDDDKTIKEVKGLRSFKFALAEFVKELLKPAWKDGQVNKEAYKTIVKKVVDKVVETLGSQIPQSKEKIDQYLSFSKPKIEKLVQAYVGKYQKA